MAVSTQASDIKFNVSRDGGGHADNDLVNYHGVSSMDIVKAAALANAGTTAAALTSTSATGGVGYATGAGGAVTQITSRSTGVTLSKVTGQITTNTASLAAAAQATFTVTNTAVAATDVVLVSIASGQSNKETRVTVSAVAAGSFDLTVFNQHASGAETGAIIINFAVVKGVAA